jgi:hypothetical protein
MQSADCIVSAVPLCCVLACFLGCTECSNVISVSILPVTFCGAAVATGHSKKHRTIALDCNLDRMLPKTLQILRPPISEIWSVNPHRQRQTSGLHSFYQGPLAVCILTSLMLHPVTFDIALHVVNARLARASVVVAERFQAVFYTQGHPCCTLTDVASGYMSRSTHGHINAHPYPPPLRVTLPMTPVILFYTPPLHRQRGLP